MTGHVTFEGAVIPLRRGRATCTILPLPPGAAAALGPARRVEGEIGEHPVNLAVARADVVDGPFLWTGKAFLRAAGIEPGEPVEVRLRPADPGHVELPEDVGSALRAAGRTAAWEALTPGRRRAALVPIAQARRAQTRAARIAKLIAAL